MFRYGMNTLDTAAAVRFAKNPDNAVDDCSSLAMAPDDIFQGKATDFFSTYLHLSQVRMQIKAGDDAADDRFVDKLGILITDQGYDQQKQGFFLYREAAETLADCIQLARTKKATGKTLDVLAHALKVTSGDAHRAAAGALGSLPLTLRASEPAGESSPTIPVVPYDSLRQLAGMEIGPAPDVVGRSLVIGSPRSPHILVLKLARKGDRLEDLQRESDWMTYLGRHRRSFVHRFHIPEPVEIANAGVFRLAGLPSDCLPGVDLHPERYALAFKTIRAYYAYPNESHPEKRLDKAGFQEVMLRNARILGRMAAMGIFHEALIPLFHNRTQRGRRDDGGAYEWVRAGRLDRWLHSCAHPNMGVSGVRDYEHLVALDGGDSRPYRSMGKQFISLLLVAGSYFRQKDPRLMGLDAAGRPVNARKLFDKTVLKKTIVGIFRNYYRGFTGDSFDAGIPFDTDRLVERMVEEMGVDRHMEEVIRAADQEALTDREFRSFLMARGLPGEKINSLAKGRADIVIQSGPHLGAFNSGISLPELIESAASMAAVCVAGKYWQERYGAKQGSGAQEMIAGSA